MDGEDLLTLLNDEEYCPCPRRFRRMQSSDEPIVIWQIVYTSVVLVVMFAALISDRLGADMVMMAALTLFMAAQIITVQEGLVGFSNQGIITVLVLFVIADGISRTGALDWYMSRLLGKPASPAGAQLRLMAPIAIVSAFLNNTPIVLVMIPIVQKWAKNIRVSVQQLLIPLSFASILGGTCTLIGTSTNLVVVGLLQDRYGDAIQIGLFDLGEYGVPVALAGIAYVLVASPFLLPGGVRQSSTTASPIDESDILLGARLTQWSPAAGRSVQRSGLRDSGGIYLVSVRRAATGHVHRAVSNDFVLNTGDILYFTGLVESFGEFCEEHGLEMVTNEIEDASLNGDTGGAEPLHLEPEEFLPRLATENEALATVAEDDDDNDGGIPDEVGITKESLLEADETERLRNIAAMADLIRGFVPPTEEDASALAAASASATKCKRGTTLAKPSHVRPTRSPRKATVGGRDPSQIVVAIEKNLVVVGINAPDRPGLLLDISKGLLRLNLELRHTEASVVDDRSVSIWRCDMQKTSTDDHPLPDLEEIWSVLSALLSEDRGVEAIKHRGLRVVRARVTKESRLVNSTAAEVEFRKLYKAAIVAVQSGGQPATSSLSKIRLKEGDVLVLQASSSSALLKRPPADFYTAKTETMTSRTTSVNSLVNMLTRRIGQTDAVDSGSSAIQPDDDKVSISEQDEGDDGFFIPDGDNIPSDTHSRSLDVVEDVELADFANGTEDDEAVWNDLQVLFNDAHEGEGATAVREFLTAMQVAPKAALIGKNVRQVGIHKLPDLILVGIDRPAVKGSLARQAGRISVAVSDVLSAGEVSSLEGTVRTDNKTFEAVDPDEPLEAGDVLWFSGPANAVGDLRKIPGLESYESKEVKKLNERVHDRRLVQAVIALSGPLVGKTVKESRFRTRYGAAVIAVHREGKRVHEHPGNVKLQAGDVLLLEAGPSFLAKTSQNDRSFALLAEVEDSAPPRLWLLIPALIITVLMLVVYVAGWTSLLVSALVATMLMIALGILTEQEARDAINWDVYITIASAFGIGTALVNSGIARAIATFLVSVGTAVGLGDAGLLGAVYFATFLISNVVTNNAAAALVFPIAMSAAEQTGTSIVLMSYSLMLGASASFMTPFGYTTNLLIYGPGGYKYMDFVWVGTPMQIVLWILSTIFLSTSALWYFNWLATGAVLLLVVMTRICKTSLSSVLPGRVLALRKKQPLPATGENKIGNEPLSI